MPEPAPAPDPSRNEPGIAPSGIAPSGSGAPSGSERLPSRSSRWWRVLLRLVVAVSVGLLAVDLARRFDGAAISLEPGWLAGALLPALLGVLVQAFGWRSLLHRLTGRELPWLEATAVYLDAQMARYTPGKVGLLAVRVAAAPRLGVSARLMIGALLIELLSWAGVGILVGAGAVAAALIGAPALLAAGASVSADVGVAMGVCSLVALVGLLTLCLLPRSRFPGWIHKALAVPELGDVDRPFVPLALPIWHVAHWLCWVSAGGILSLGVGASWSAAVLCGGVLCLAVVLGFLAVVAPAGAGVREVVISAGTAPVLGPSAALVLGLTARVVSLASDFSCWTVVRLLAVRFVRGR